MKTKVENNSETQIVVTITLGKAELADAEKVALHKLAKTLKVAGFRKGKVPASVAAKHVEPSALAEETVENAVSKAVATVFVEQDLRVISRPDIELKKFVPSQELEFTATAEVVPKFKLADYTKLKAPKQEVAKVTKKDVDEVVERIRTQMATRVDAKDRAAKDGDVVTIDYIGKKDDVAFDGGTATDYDLHLGSGSFIPGFEEGIVGHKAGEAFDLPLTFPKQYHSKDLAGAKVVFTTTIKKIQENQLPELNDEWAAKVGPFTSVKDLTDDIKRELTARQEQEAEQQLQDALLEQLVEKTKVAVPEVLRQDQLQSIEQDLTQNLMYQGLTLEKYLEEKGYKTRDEWIEKEAGELADKRVKTGMVLSELSRAEKLEVSQDELAARMAELRAQYDKQPEMLERLEDAEVQRDLSNRILTEKTIARLVELNRK